MLDLFRAAPAGQTARRQQGASFAASKPFPLDLSTFKTGLRLLLLTLALALSTTSCVKDDDEVQCGDEHNPCIVIDEMGDG